MCTYITDQISINGSVKGSDEWKDVDRAMVYVDHPVSAMAEHSLNIDLYNTKNGLKSRVALELNVDSALNLANSIISSVEGYKKQSKLK